MNMTKAKNCPFEQINADEYVFQGKIDLDIFNEIMGYRDCDRQRGYHRWLYLWTGLAMSPAEARALKRIT